MADSENIQDTLVAFTSNNEQPEVEQQGDFKNTNHPACEKPKLCEKTKQAWEAQKKAAQAAVDAGLVPATASTS